MKKASIFGIAAFVLGAVVTLAAQNPSLHSAFVGNVLKFTSGTTGVLDIDGDAFAVDVKQAGKFKIAGTALLDANSAFSSQKVALGGGSTSTLAGRLIGGLTDPSSTASGSTQNTEYTLNSITLPASAFNANTRGISCQAWGTGAGNANAKNYKFYFGTTAVTTLTGTTDNTKDYLAEMVVLRTGASTQSGFGTITSDIGAPDALAANAAIAETDTGAIVIAFKSANTAAAATSATGKGMSCAFIN